VSEAAVESLLAAHANRPPDVKRQVPWMKEV
jgi:hypothetical protein